MNSEFELGKCYFHLGYHDRNLSVPFVEPYFFLGMDIFPEGQGFWFFQRAKTFLNGQKPSSFDECDQSEVIMVEEARLDQLLDWGGLVNELTENKKMQDQGQWLSQKR